MLYDAQRRGELATTGPYAHVRHPQYVGFILVMVGFLPQWPTLLTLAMFPVLVWMYIARQEEREAEHMFGPAYVRYASEVPDFIPRLGPCSSARRRRKRIVRTRLFRIGWAISALPIFAAWQRSRPRGEVRIAGRLRLTLERLGPTSSWGRR